MLKISCYNSRLFAQTFLFPGGGKAGCIQQWQGRLEAGGQAVASFRNVLALCMDATSLGDGRRVRTVAGGAGWKSCRTGKQPWGCKSYWSRATRHMQPPWWRQRAKLWQQQEGTWKCNDKLVLCKAKWEYRVSATLWYLCCTGIRNDMQTWTVLSTCDPEIICIYEK